MKKYTFIYRCRICNEVFNRSHTTDERTAGRCVYNSIWADTFNEPQGPGLFSVHETDTHMGVADFIGCEITGEND